MSLIGSRKDPLGSYNFLVILTDSGSQLTFSLNSIASFSRAGFSECSGLETTLDVEEYKEGGNNSTVLKFPTRVSYSPIRLKRGMGLDNDLWNWYYGFIKGQGKRRDGLIALQNDDREPVKIWQFRRGIPTKYNGPSLNASQSQVAVEEIEITHEGLELLGSDDTSVSIGDIANAVGSVATAVNDLF